LVDRRAARATPAGSRLDTSKRAWPPSRLNHRPKTCAETKVGQFDFGQPVGQGRIQVQLSSRQIRLNPQGAWRSEKIEPAAQACRQFETDNQRRIKSV
jgi:hypothetical protein